MAVVRFRSATSTDAMSNRKFNVIGGNGAILNVWASGVTAADVIGLSVGDRDVLVQGSPINVEASTYVIDIDRDHVVVDEVVEPGQIFMPITATTAVNVLMTIRYL